MLPILQIFGLALQLPPFTVLIGLMLSLTIAGRLAEQQGLNGDVISNAGVVAFVTGVLGARLGYVALNWSVYQQDLSAVLALNVNGLLAASGWVCALIVGVFYLRQKHLLTWQTLDVIAPAMVFFLACWALSALFSGDGFGTLTTVPWAIDLWGAQRHPVQAYEAVLLVGLAFGLWRIGQRSQQHGYAALSLVIGVALIRVFVDGFRADVPLIVGLRTTQLCGVFVSSVALWLMTQRQLTKNSA